MTLSIEQLDGLRALADEIGGWVMFNDESGEEEFVPSARWQDLYADWLAQKTARRSGPR
ncbi:MAG: hypothetical protein HOW73_51110 [Polyangiaceae bacterium]|nr:hypothetical protein [Polyangiaceae bacterium]